MTARNLELAIAPDRSRTAPDGWVQGQFDEALAGLKRLKGLMRWRSVRLLVEDPRTVPNPVKTFIALLMLAPGSAELVSLDGEIRLKIDLATVLRAAWRGAFSKRRLKQAIDETFEILEDTPRRQSGFDESIGPPFYLRTNLWFGARVGGAFSHAAGVINAIRRNFGDVLLATTDDVPCLDPAIEIVRIDLAKIDGWDAGPGVHFIANKGLFEEALRSCPRPPFFIYQRSGLGDISGLRLARHWRRPFVLEYNGPEVWVAKNWGGGLPLAKQFDEVETAQLRRADLVLAVSRPLVDDIIRRGVDPRLVLLSPNAVDPDRFHPDVDGSQMRRSLGLGARRAAVLLSSFGPWHGAEVAIEAYALLLAERPRLADETALILAGDGQRRQSCKELARNRGLREGETIFFPGMIPAKDAPSILAIGEILLCPTIENPDGTEFFGSPTKIFEYMAMGKTIIASDIAQIGEMLVDRKTALLVKPGDADDLKRALAIAFGEGARLEIGARARKVAVAEHSWDVRIRTISERLVELGLIFP